MASNKGNSVVDDVKSGLKGIHSAGEAIRGAFNESVDHAFKDKAGEAKNQAITDKGVQGVRATDQHFGTHHGIAANSGVRTGGIGDATTRTGETTGAGTHSGAPGNLGGSAAGGVVQGARAPAQEDVRTVEKY